MYKNKSKEGNNNIVGEQIHKWRKETWEDGTRISQQKFASMLQLYGVDVDKNAIQRMECGKRFITDIELRAISACTGKSYEELLGVAEPIVQKVPEDKTDSEEAVLADADVRDYRGDGAALQATTEQPVCAPFTDN